VKNAGSEGDLVAAGDVWSELGGVEFKKYRAAYVVDSGIQGIASLRVSGGRAIVEIAFSVNE